MLTSLSVGQNNWILNYYKFINVRQQINIKNTNKNEYIWKQLAFDYPPIPDYSSNCIADLMQIDEQLDDSELWIARFTRHLVESVKDIDESDMKIES